MVFNGPKKPSEILLETIKSLPSAEIRNGMIWHLGNICEIDENGLYFRVGRTTKAKREIYQDGNFTDEEFEEAPYTHIILDIPIEVCAIAKKAKLSPSPKGIANQLIKLFAGSEPARHYGAKFEIDWLKNPEDLIAHLKRAYTISRFSMTFSRPNPFDVEEDIIGPFSKFIKEAQAEKGKAQVEGENLKPQLLEDLTRSAAATGNDAMARLQLDKEQPQTTIHLRENPVFIQQDDVSDDEQKRTLLDKVRQIYRKVRGKLSNE
jgi:hypothetical protein